MNSTSFQNTGSKERTDTHLNHHGSEEFTRHLLDIYHGIIEER
jgi:hypothetical protein